MRTGTPASLAATVVSVTHPDVTRYFMTIPEAVQLVLHAVTIGSGGETFVLDMGQPVRIADLAKDLIELSGLRVDHDIRIEFTGLRAGEKMFEELFLDCENHPRTSHDKIFIARSPAAASFHDHELQALIHAAGEGDRARTQQLLARFVTRVGGRLSGPALVPAAAAVNSVTDRKSAALLPN